MAKTAGVVHFGLPPGRLVVAPVQIHIQARAVAPLVTTQAARLPSQLEAATLALLTAVIVPTKVTGIHKAQSHRAKPYGFCLQLKTGFGKAGLIK